FTRLLARCATSKFARAGFAALTDLPAKARAELPAACPRLAEAVVELERVRHACAALSLADNLVVHAVRQLQEELAACKGERGLQSFEDMLTQVDNALDPATNARRATALTALLRNRYRWAVVDEFQDTDPIQWRIFRRLFVESEAGHRLFVVGDPKQAIF